MSLAIKNAIRFLTVSLSVAALSACSILTSITAPSTVTPGEVFEVLIENEFVQAFNLGSAPDDSSEGAGYVFALFLPVGWSIDTSQSTYTIQTLSGDFELDVFQLPGLPNSELGALIEEEDSAELELLLELECPLFIEFAEETIPEDEGIQVVYIGVDLNVGELIEIEIGDTGELSLSVRAGGLGGNKELVAIHGFYGVAIDETADDDSASQEPEPVDLCLWFPGDEGQQGPDDIIFPSFVTTGIFQDGNETFVVSVMNPALVTLLVLLLAGVGYVSGRSRGIF